MIKIAPSSDLAVEDMTNLMTWAMVNMGPFHRETCSSSASKMWDPAQLRPLDSLWNHASDCAARTILLALYNSKLTINRGKGNRSGAGVAPLSTHRLLQSISLWDLQL